MSDRNDRRTPIWLYRQLWARFGPFNVDVAANEQNALVRTAWLGPGSAIAEDALSVEWCGPALGLGAVQVKAWGNIPYGPPGTIDRWIRYAQAQRDEWRTRALFVLPADVSTQWYAAMVRDELVEVIPFRVAFGSGDGSTRGNSAKFGSLVVWIAPKVARAHGAKGER